MLEFAALIPPLLKGKLKGNKVLGLNLGNLMFVLDSRVLQISAKRATMESVDVVRLRLDTWNCAKLIHGGSEMKPVLNGILECVASKR